MHFRPDSLALAGCEATHSRSCTSILMFFQTHLRACIFKRTKTSCLTPFVTIESAHALVCPSPRYKPPSQTQCNAQEGLAETKQLCDLLTMDHIEDVTQPQKRAARFPALRPARLLVILPKYRCQRPAAVLCLVIRRCVSAARYCLPCAQAVTASSRVPQLPSAMV